MPNKVYSGPYTMESGTRIYKGDWPIGSVFQGRASYFGGSTDNMDNGSADSSHGIAFPATSTRGGYFIVKAPNGRVKLLKQVEYGPADWVGGGNRIVDILFNTLGDFGYTTSNFPTDQGTWTLVYMGMKKPNYQGMLDALKKAGVKDDGIAGAVDDLGGTVDDVTGAIGDVVTKPLDLIARLVGIITSGSFWLNAGKIIIGAIILLLALARVMGVI